MDLRYRTRMYVHNVYVNNKSRRWEFSRKEKSEERMTPSEAFNMKDKGRGGGGDT